jgi:hypothetical protein
VHHTYRPTAMRLYTAAYLLAVLGSVASLARAVSRVWDLSVTLFRHNSRARAHSPRVHNAQVHTGRT